MVENAVTEIVDTQLESKLAENEREVADRQSREKNVIIFNIDEPNANLIAERVALDTNTIEKLIEEMNFETEQATKIEKIIRIGKRGAKSGEKPRPIIVTFSTVEAKRLFLN